MFKQSVSLVLMTLSLGSLVSCGSKVADKPVAAVKSATSSAMTTTTGGKPAAGALAVVPAGVTINTDLQQELSSGKNRNNEKFTIKVKNGSVGKYPALKDAIIEGHLEKIGRAHV